MEEQPIPVRSWLASANNAHCSFPLYHLPYGVFRHPSSSDARLGVAIGDSVLDLGACQAQDFFSGLDDHILFSLRCPHLNELAELGPAAWRALRQVLLRVLSEEYPHRDSVRHCLLPLDRVELLMPLTIGDYTDFYASIHHATNVGSMFRPQNPLLPNYKYVPIAYHGRTSSIVLSGSPARRPWGQVLAAGAEAPVFQPSAMLDYELELAAITGPGNAPGHPIALSQAEDHIFGVCLVNDWSARDLQSWEYQPLGPFLSKNFATSMAPWVTPWEALQPFRAPAFPRADGDPPPLPYLDGEENRARGGLDIQVEVLLRSQRMRRDGMAPLRVSEGNTRNLYWTFAQMLTHHTSNGCNLRPADMCCSGTISGPTPGERGCLLERTWRGAQPLTLPTGEQRRFLEDGDEVILRGWCERGELYLGLGECLGVVEAALPLGD